MKVLHVIRRLTGGGASRGLWRMCTDGPDGVRPTVASLLPPEPDAAQRFADADIEVIDGLCMTVDRIGTVDLVQVEWWNNPHVNELLVDVDLPETNILLHARGHSDAPWMCPSVALLKRVDGCSVTTPSANNASLERNRLQAGLPPVICVYSAASLDEANDGYTHIDDRHVVFGYLGTVEPIKMHAATLPMVAAIAERVPTARFVFAGEGTLNDYEADARELGIDERVSFVGFQDPSTFLRSIDVFLYPLNPFTYATSEKALQEAMLAGLPCVAFPVGGIKDLLTPDSAMVVESPEACIAACVTLALDSSLRSALGQRARHRVTTMPERIGWREALVAARDQAMARAPRPRPALGISSDGLLTFVTDPGCIRAPAGTSSEDELDFARVSRFVREDYDVYTATTSDEDGTSEKGGE